MVNEFRDGDRAAKHWFIGAFLWFPFFTTFGFFLALKFFMPTFLSGDNWLTFGRLRPAHVNGLLFGFLSSSLIAAMLYIVPRLAKKPLAYPRLASLAALLWNGGIVTGVALILLGGSQGREYAELPWVVDLLVIGGLVSLLFIVFSTILRRREPKLYVSLWYFAGTVIWFPIVYFIGNVMWRPPEGALNGTADAIFNWYYGHNVLGLWFTTLGIPIWYYAIPKIIKRPLYSHVLSLIAFFSIAFFYTGVGSHHLLQAPIPEWLKTVAVVMSILMIVPVITFATNILLTMRGSWRSLARNTPFQFIMAGFVMYVLVSFQGSFQATRTTNLYLHFSQWPVGHAHLALLGGFGFLSVGVAYWLVPKITGRRLYSKPLAAFSFWLAISGFIVFFSAMTIAGLVANSAWWEHLNLVAVLPQLRTYFILRAIGGGMIVIAAYLFAFNILMTFAKPSLATAEPDEDELPGPYPRETAGKGPVRGPSTSLPVFVVGGMVLFVLMTFMVVAMPYMFAPSAPSQKAHMLTPAEETGQSLYRSNGCFYCHSQFVRETDWAWGEVSNAGDFFYSIPNFLGTERTGPNLGQIGGKRPTQWHYFHYENPRTVSPTSIMPNFAFLSQSELDALVSYVNTLGGKDLATDAFQPIVPPEYRDEQNPYMPTMMQAMQAYDPKDQTFSGSEALAKQWANVFEAGKILFSRNCVPCHGGSGNGQGTYGRYVVTRPANLRERIANYPEPDAPFHFWRVSEGVPGTAMPPWKFSLSDTQRWQINTFEMTFPQGGIRTVSGDVSDQEAIDFANRTGITPPIQGTQQQFEEGKGIFELYCAQCHGDDGHGDGPASIVSPYGYIQPEPANFEETGTDFEQYGQYVWKVREGVETTHMPMWKLALSEEEVYRVIFYIQGFATAEDYNSKWGPLYAADFARNLKR